MAERQFALRFAGQSYSLDVPAPSGPIDPAALAKITERFVTRYRERYHHANTNVPIELDQVRVAVRGPTPNVILPQIPPSNAPVSHALRGARRVYLPERGGYEDCPVYDRYGLGAGATLTGPAIVEEHELTVVLGVGAEARIDVYGNLIVTLPHPDLAA